MNQDMNQEELKYHKALQPLYEKAMGPWQAGDNCYDEENKPNRGIITAIDHWSLQFYCYEDGLHYTYSLDNAENDLGHIPLTIDDRNPERGLWGMVNPSSLIYLKPVFNMFYRIEGRLEEIEVDNDNHYKQSFHSGEWGCKIRGFDDPFIANTPTLAILKALVAQEGVEV